MLIVLGVSGLLGYQWTVLRNYTHLHLSVCLSIIFQSLYVDNHGCCSCVVSHMDVACLHSGLHSNVCLQEGPSQIILSKIVSCFLPLPCFIFPHSTQYIFAMLMYLFPIYLCALHSGNSMRPEAFWFLYFYGKKDTMYISKYLINISELVNE